MTVKELKEALSAFPDDYEVNLIGGEGCYGDWAELEVGTRVNRPYTDFYGVTTNYLEFKAEAVIMEY